MWFSCAEADECSSASASAIVAVGRNPLLGVRGPLLRYTLPQAEELLVESQKKQIAPPRFYPFCIALPRRRGLHHIYIYNSNY